MTFVAASNQSTATTVQHDGADLFTQATRDALHAICGRVARAVDWPVELEFGATDDGVQQWAALSVSTLPPGAFGTPGLLATVVMGPDIGAHALIFSAYCRDALCKVTGSEHITDGLRIAEAEAARNFADLAEGAFA